MNNLNETIGLRIESIIPSHQSSNVNVWSNVVVTFTADVDPSTLTRNIVVFEDTNNVYENIESLRDYSNFGVVHGTISYKDRVLTFAPSERFNTSTKYILVLNNQITDITGVKLTNKYVTVFITEDTVSFPKCEFTKPKYGLITNEVPEFQWKDISAPSYIFQISKSNTFELLLLEKVVTDCSYLPSDEDVIFEEGVYYIRVKAETSDEWSDIHQIFIKPITDAVVAKEDTPEVLNFKDFMDGIKDPIEILEWYPPTDSSNISLKTNIFYAKIKGRIDADRLNLDDCYIYGEAIDYEHPEYGTELMEGTWNVVYDLTDDVTYVIFDTDGDGNAYEEIMDNVTGYAYFKTRI